MPFQPIKSLLPQSIKRAGFVKQIEASRICTDFDNLIKDILSPEISSQVKAMYFKGNILTIAVLDSNLAQEIKLRENYILNRLNNKYNNNLVLGLRFLV